MPKQKERPDWSKIYAESTPEAFMAHDKRQAILDRAFAKSGYRFEGLTDEIKTSQDLDALLLGDGFLPQYSELGMTDWYGDRVPSSELARRTDVSVWSPAAIRAVCQAAPNVANALLEKTGLTSEQCAALSDGLKDARQPSVSIWASVKYAIAEGTVDLGFPGAQELLRTWILRAEEAPMESLQNNKLEENIRRMPADVLASLPATPGWSARWLKYLGSSFVPLPESFWRAAYKARNRGGEPDLVFRWPGFVHYPELARELKVRKGGYSGSLGERAGVLAGHEIARYGYSRNPLNGWSDWHAIHLGKTLEAAAAEALGRPEASDVQDLAALVLAWPTRRSLPAALLESRRLPEPVQVACIARWRRESRARWSDWSGMCQMSPANVFEMAARYLASLAPDERTTQMEKAPVP